MLALLNDVLVGWREVRTTQGFSYQVSRTGKRRVEPVDNYGRRGTIDADWLIHGVFADEKLHKNYRKCDPHTFKKKLRLA